jgi:hypothetical protein
LTWRMRSELASTRSYGSERFAKSYVGGHAKHPP